MNTVSSSSTAKQYGEINWIIYFIFTDNTLSKHYYWSQWENTSWIVLCPKSRLKQLFLSTTWGVLLTIPQLSIQLSKEKSICTVYVYAYMCMQAWLYGPGSVNAFRWGGRRGLSLSSLAKAKSGRFSVDSQPNVLDTSYTNIIWML